jgi:hypothetical protein
MSRWVLLPAAVVCLLGGLHLLRLATADRELVASTPSPRPLFAVTYVALPARERLCLSRVTIPTDAQQVRMQVKTDGRPGPALAVELSAPGYRDRVLVPAGYPDGTTLSVPMRPPDATRLGAVCLSHAGGPDVALAGTTEDRTQSRPQGRLAGRPEPADTYLAFYEDGRASALDRVGAIVARMSAFKPGIVGPWLLWPLLVLAFAGVPAGVAWAAVRAVRS